MSCFAQTPSGDFDISSGNLRVEKSVAQCTAWKLDNLLDFWKGEWFRDQRQGIPYLQYVYVKNPDLRLIASLYERVILSAPGVAAIASIDLSYNPAKRTLAPSFVAVTNDGSTLRGGVGAPFLVQPTTHQGDQ